MEQETAAERRVLALVDDLLFASRIEGTLDAQGYVVRIAPIAAESAAIAREWRPALVVVNFGVPSGDWEGAIRAIRADAALTGTPIVAFGPHVETEGRAAAQAAGATRVVTNGAFFNRMAEIVGSVASSQ